MRAILLFSVLPLLSQALPSPAFTKRVNDLTSLVDDQCRGIKDPNEKDAWIKPEKYEQLVQALGDAQMMLQQTIKEWWEDGEHGELAEFFFDIPNDGTYKDNELAQRVHANLLQASKVDSHPGFFGHDIDIGCTDWDDKCNQKWDPKNGGSFIGGYAADNRVTMCDGFYGSTSLEEAYQTLLSVKDRPDLYFGWAHNQAEKMIHELMHTKAVYADRPAIIDVEFDGARVYTAARIEEWKYSEKAHPSDYTLNADNYATFVNAMYMKSRLGWLPPWSMQGAFTEKRECPGGNEGEQNYVHWTQLDQKIDLFCERLSGEYKPTLGSALWVEYNKFTSDHMEIGFFSKNRPKPGRMPKTEIYDFCREKLKSIADCEGDVDATFKHGGHVTIFQEDPKGGPETEVYTFSVIPKHVRVDPIPESPPSHCYMIPHDCSGDGCTPYVDIIIYGGLFAGQDFGKDYLLPELSKCAEVSDWEWSYFDEPHDGSGSGDNDYLNKDTEWKAMAKLTTGSEAGSALETCTAEALVNAGAAALSTQCYYQYNWQ